MRGIWTMGSRSPSRGHRSAGQKRLLVILSIISFAILPSFRIPKVYATWLGNYDKRIKLTIDHLDVTSDLTNFPVLVYLSTASGRGSPQDDLSCVFNELTSDANRKKIAVTINDGTT